MNVQPHNSAQDIETRAAKVAAAIARLRTALQDTRLLAASAVQDELHKFEAQLVPYLSVTRNPGRHRSGVLRGGTPDAERPMEDVAGCSTKPDPLETTTAAEFMAKLRGYREWAGNPSYRKMADQAGQTRVHSTMHAALSSDELPKQDVMKAIVIGCGASEEDVRAFVTAWRRINAHQAEDMPRGAGLLPAPVPVLTLVSS
jgi:hypothetical protein